MDNLIVFCYLWTDVKSNWFVKQSIADLMSKTCNVNPLLVISTLNPKVQESFIYKVKGQQL